jgi:hypothetical protein
MKSIIILDFIDITEIARAAPSRQVPGGCAKPRAFSGLRESLQVPSKGQCASNCSSKRDRFSGSEWFFLRIEAESLPTRRSTRRVKRCDLAAGEGKRAGLLGHARAVRGIQRGIVMALSRKLTQDFRSSSMSNPKQILMIGDGTSKKWRDTPIPRTRELPMSFRLPPTGRTDICFDLNTE